MNTDVDGPTVNKDAAHPQDWPYELKAMGWAAWPIDTWDSYATSGCRAWSGESGFSSATDSVRRPRPYPGAPSSTSSRAAGAAIFRWPPVLALRRPKAETAAPSSTMATGTTSAVR